MARYTAILILIVCGFFQEAHAQWTIRKVGKQEYVTLDNVQQFYRFPHRKISNKSIILHGQQGSIQATIGSKELLINGIKFILAYPVVESSGEVLISRMDLSKLIEPILRPGHIKGAADFNTIILDPGHGGHDKGAVGPWGNEKDFNLDVARRARNILTAQGYEVKFTRSTDVFIPLHDRANFANRHKNAIFISIHFNASNNRNATGIETFTLAPRGVPSTAQDGPRVSDFVQCKGNARDQENMALATAMHSSMLKHLQLFDRGVKRARFVVIREITIPGVLLEGGFVSHPKDSHKIASSQFRQQFALAIADAVRKYKISTTSPQPTPYLQKAEASATIRP